VASDGVAAEQLGRDDSVAKLLEELGIVGAIDACNYRSLLDESAPLRLGGGVGPRKRGCNIQSSFA